MTHLEVLTLLFERYAERIRDYRNQISCYDNKCSPDHLLSLCNEAIQNGAIYPIDKLNRWLGFVQGVLAVYGVIDVDAERDFTRPLFHKLYGREVPTF